MIGAWRKKNDEKIVIFEGKTKRGVVSDISSASLIIHINNIKEQFVNKIWDKTLSSPTIIIVHVMKRKRKGEIHEESSIKIAKRYQII